MAALGRVLAGVAVTAAAALVLLASAPAAGVKAPLCAAVPAAATWVDQLALPQCGVVDHLPGSSRHATPCRWVTPPARHGLEIAAGRISCPGAGPCVEHRSGFATTWLGRPAPPVELRCADGRVVTAQVAGLAYADKAGKFCAIIRPRQALNVLRFRVPATWGGHLIVIWALGAVTRSGSPIDLQVEDAILPLAGKQFACFDFLSAGPQVQ